MALKFAKFTEKYLCRSLFLKIKIIEKEIPAQIFSCECCKIFKNTLLTEPLHTTAFKLKLTLHAHILAFFNYKTKLGTFSNKRQKSKEIVTNNTFGEFFYI